MNNYFNNSLDDENIELSPYLADSYDIVKYDQEVIQIQLYVNEKDPLSNKLKIKIDKK